MVRLLVTTHQGTAKEVRVTGDKVIIGRGTDCDVVVSDPTVSRLHARLQRIDGQWMLESLGTNGTWINETELPRGVSMPIRAQDRIACGDNTTIEFDDAAGKPTQPAKNAPEISPLAKTQPPPLRPAAVAGPGVLQFPGTDGIAEVTDAAPFAYGRASILFRAKYGGEDHCVKMFHHVRGSTWPSRASFEREINAHKRLVHPNILRVIDHGLSSIPHGCPFIVMPLCTDGSLRSLLSERKYYNLDTVLPFLQGVAAAVDFAHAQGVVHGDIKPENVLLSAARKTAVLSDFGMSSVVAAQESSDTQVMPLGGTSAYLSPEHLTSNQQNPPADIFAFALVCYELLTGRLPYDIRQPVFLQMKAKVEGQVSDARALNPGITDVCWAALKTALDPDPLRRPRSAGELCRRMSEAASAAPDRGAKRTVFLSYCRADESWLHRIRVHMQPLEKRCSVEVWHDGRIKVGTPWQNEIAIALEQAAVAILLVSADFLASAFCSDFEVPKLLQRRAQGALVIPLFVSPVSLSGTAMEFLQGANRPTKTLAEMEVAESERILSSLVRQVQEHLGAGL
jgi:serine/threonine protein kinase